MALEAFLKQKNKRNRKRYYILHQSLFVDEDGRPMMWKLRPLGTLEAEKYP